MTTLDLFSSVSMNEVVTVNNVITTEEILLSQADENQLINPISDNDIDFTPFTEVEKTKGITLNQLAKASDIVDKNGELNNGINAYSLLNEVFNICNENKLNYKVADLFVADNKNKALGNGVSINKQLAEAYQQKNKTENIPFAATTFNRIFANINLIDFSTDTHVANIVVATNQKGLQVAIGANCYACRNQTILGSKQIVSTYGMTDKIKDINSFIAAVKQMIKEYSFERDMKLLEQMKAINIDANQIYQMIGELTAIRCSYDSKVKDIKNLCSADVYPLNQSQICKFTESLLLTYSRNRTLNLYDVYQSATTLYKVVSMDLPNVLPQNNSFSNYIRNKFNIAI